MTHPSYDQIALRSFLIWQEEGCPDGCALDHWLQAEQELRKLFNPEPRPPFEIPGRLPAEARKGTTRKKAAAPRRSAKPARRAPGGKAGAAKAGSGSKARMN